MSEIKKYYWLIPLVGGFFSLIGFLFPAWYSPPFWVEYVWMIGVIHHVTGGNVVEMAPSDMFIPSLIASILIFVCSCLVILVTLLKSRSKTFSSNKENIWIVMSIVEISATIYYILGIQNGFFLYSTLNFWDFYEIQFGLIVPFIGGNLTLIGGIIGKLVKRSTKGK
ncbi:MAG: hypothetical protein ACW98X_08105 [Promethearchaeota archaeon]